MLFNTATGNIDSNNYTVYNSEKYYTDVKPIKINGRYPKSIKYRQRGDSTPREVNKVLVTLLNSRKTLVYERNSELADIYYNFIPDRKQYAVIPIFTSELIWYRYNSIIFSIRYEDISDEITDSITYNRPNNVINSRRSWTVNYVDIPLKEHLTPMRRDFPMHRVSGVHNVNRVFKIPENIYRRYITTSGISESISLLFGHTTPLPINRRPNGYTINYGGFMGYQEPIVYRIYDD